MYMQYVSVSAKVILAGHSMVYIHLIRNLAFERLTLPGGHTSLTIREEKTSTKEKAGEGRPGIVHRLQCKLQKNTHTLFISFLVN